MTATETTQCPSCGQAREDAQCVSCGYFEIVDMPQVTMEPAREFGGGPQNITAVCECGLEMVPDCGRLVCPDCIVPREMPECPRPVEDDHGITAEFLLCMHPSLGDDKQPCNRDLITGTNYRPSRFVCPLCGDEQPVPGTQSAVAQAIASVPVVGPAVVQATEFAMRPLQKRRR